jgi:hypothetical protein
MCFADPRYEEEVSGCTASVGILSAKKIYVVSLTLSTMTNFQADQCRAMLEILEVCWVLRVEPSRFRLTTNHKTKVDILMRKAGT